MSAIIRRPGEGESRWFFGGGLHQWRLGSAETRGAFALLEDVLTRGKVTPLHLHPESDETTYILEGEILFRADSAEEVLGAGTVIMVPRGTAHAFKVLSETARILVVTPPPVEAFFRQASEASSPDGSGPVDFRKVGAAGKETGAMEILGPPPFRN
ncbi:MAG: cupin domain-containing protein [Polyangiaceae bacterium]|nr:cupin domain-containing protein [Polyangiaceae bacterium]